MLTYRKMARLSIVNEDLHDKLIKTFNIRFELLFFCQFESSNYTYNYHFNKSSPLAVFITDRVYDV